MREYRLKYGCNPHQKPAKIYVKDFDLPICILNSNPGYINLLDALNGWQLVKELDEITGLPAATSFKHVSPAGVALGLPLDELTKKVLRVDDLEHSPLSSAYARARGADRMSSFGDFVALSRKCDKQTALLLKREVSDGIIAPDYDNDALEILKSKKKGKYIIISIDPNYKPKAMEYKEVFGITFEQKRNDAVIDKSLCDNIVTKNKILNDDVLRDLIVATITLKYTQSNSVCYARNGMAIGIGAGQQSRIHCTRLAGDKADKFHLRFHPQVLNLPFRDDLPRPVIDNVIDVYLSEFDQEILGENVFRDYFKYRPQPLESSQKLLWVNKINGVSLSSDAFFPFDDNIKRAVRSGVSYIIQPGGSVRDKDVIDCCDNLNILMAFSNLRLFHH